MISHDWLVSFQGTVIGSYSGYTRSEVLEEIYDLGFSPDDVRSGAVEFRLIPCDEKEG